MNIQPIISSLSIKKLFGEHDLSINFSNKTVIVGKNGLGKTTILKVINGLITDNNHIDYESICESIELTLGDGNPICYGVISEKLVQSFYKNDLEDLMLQNEIIKKTIKEKLEKDDYFKDQKSEEVINSIISSFAKNEHFLNATKNKIMETFNGKKDVIAADKEVRKKLKKSVLVRYISTVNISANAGNKMDFGNSIEKNLLDLAIYEELRLLLKSENSSAITRFEHQLNTFLKDSSKKVRRDHNDWIFITDAGLSLSLSQLSSGERQLVYILATAANTYDKPTLFLMDEPEVSLHLSWQEKIIDAIMSINSQMQIIAVTHSPGIVMNGHMDAYVEMKNILKVSNDA